MMLNMEFGRASVLLLHDLSNTLHIIDHDILLDRQNRVGFLRMVLYFLQHTYKEQANMNQTDAHDL